MKRNRQFAMVVALATLAWLPLAAQSSKIYRDGNGWVEEISGTLPAARTVRVHTEMGSILATKDRGRIYFFSMATSFTAAALGAEGVAKDATLVVGNGYVPGHAELTLDLLRRDAGLRALFEERYGR